MTTLDRQKESSKHWRKTMSDNSNGELRKVVCHASGDRCHACDHYYGRAESCEFKPTATSSDASELVKEILAETDRGQIQ
jgi:hypothetical protein